MKKGFTLIELLSVIVIIAVISLITIPTIFKVVEKARLGGAKSSMISYENAIDNQIAINDVREKGYKLKPGIYVLPLNKNFDIKIHGRVPTEGWIEIDKNGVLNYKAVIDDKYVVTKEENKITVEKKKEDISIMPDYVYAVSDEDIKTNDQVVGIYYCGISARQNLNTCTDSNIGANTEEELRDMISDSMSSVPSDLIVQKMLYRRSYKAFVGNSVNRMERVISVPVELTDTDLKSESYAKLDLDTNGKVKHISLCNKKIDSCYIDNGDFDSYRTHLLNLIEYDTRTWTKGELVSWKKEPNDVYSWHGPDGDSAYIGSNYLSGYFKSSLSFNSYLNRISVMDYNDNEAPDCSLYTDNNNVAHYDCIRGYR